MGQRLIQDNDSHWYVIPWDQVDAFWQWVGYMESGADTKLDFSAYRVDGRMLSRYLIGKHHKTPCWCGPPPQLHLAARR